MTNTCYLLLSIVTVLLILVLPSYSWQFTYTQPAHYAGVDKFGTKEMYSTKPGGEEWFMNTNAPGNDPRTRGEGPSTTFSQQNDDGSWKVQSTKVRYGALT